MRWRITSRKRRRYSFFRKRERYPTREQTVIDQPLAVSRLADARMASGWPSSTPKHRPIRAHVTPTAVGATQRGRRPHRSTNIESRPAQHPHAVRVRPRLEPAVRRMDRWPRYGNRDERRLALTGRWCSCRSQAHRIGAMVQHRVGRKSGRPMRRQACRRGIRVNGL